MKQFWILLFCCLNIHWASAQWTREDSVWLENVLEGKDTLRLDPEVQRAIENGTFLHPETPLENSFRTAPVRVPLIKDFSEYILPDTVFRSNLFIRNILATEFFWRRHLPMAPPLPVLQSIRREFKYKPCTAPSAIRFDFGALTSRKAFIHRRNARRDSTWRNYNNLPTPELLSRRKLFLKQLSGDTLSKK